MSPDFVLGLMNESMTVATMIGLPILLSTLVVGVIISLFQAVTQIQEMTLTFVPKMAFAIIILYLLGPWMLDKMIVFTNHVFTELLLIK